VSSPPQAVASKASATKPTASLEIFTRRECIPAWISNRLASALWNS
jgi:hypothetical protein